MDTSGTTDVTPAASSPAPAPSGAAPVTAAPGLDRPLENIQAEFNRKYDRLEAQVQNLVAYLTTPQQPTLAEPAPTTAKSAGDLSDEELWQRATRGDREAFEMYQARIADRQIVRRSQEGSRTTLVNRQMQILLQRYPALRDPSHPLNQHANACYNALLAEGYPANAATLLEAAKTAIADRPDIVVQLNTPAPGTSPSRRTATAGQMGATHRADSPAPDQVHAVTRDEAQLAKRMGIKDPLEAKKRFLKRQEEGTSGVNPNLAVALEREGQDI